MSHPNVIQLFYNSISNTWALTSSIFSNLCPPKWPHCYPPTQILNQWRDILNCLHLFFISIVSETPAKEVSSFTDDTLRVYFLTSPLFINTRFFLLLFILKILNTWLYFKAACATFIVLPSARLLSLCSAFDTKLNDQLISLAYLAGCWHWAPSSFCFPVLFLYHSATCVFLWGHT